LHYGFYMSFSTVAFKFSYCAVAEVSVGLVVTFTVGLLSSGDGTPNNICLNLMNI